jgi:hypothetical protein
VLKAEREARGLAEQEPKEGEGAPVQVRRNDQPQRDPDPCVVDHQDSTERTQQHPRDVAL